MSRSTLPRAFAAVLSTSIVLAACGGGGGSSVAPGGSSTPSATPTPVTQAAAQVAVSGSAQTASYAVTNYSATTTFPAASASTNLATTFTTSQPSGTATIQSLTRRPQNIGAAPISPIAFLCIDASSTVTLAGLPSFALTVPSSLAAAVNYTYVALYDPTKSAAGWTTETGPATVSGSVFSIPGNTTPLTLQSGQTYCLMIFTLTSLLPTPAPVATATATAPAGASSDSAYTCPQSDQTFDSVARTTSGGASSVVHRSNGLRVARTNSVTPGLLAVTYSASAVNGNSVSTSVTTRETAAGATLVRSFAFTHSGTVLHVLSVPPAQMNAIASTLRTQAGVVSVAPTGAHRYSTAITTPYYPNDPYFNGFTAAQNNTVQESAAATYHVAPYDESSVVPGQWDMHAIGLENALAYGGQRVNGSGIFNAAALGSASIKLAIIDTGSDPTHPELASKIVYQKCYISDPTGNQSTSNFETDPLGHGTDTAGIAAEDTNNGFGFAGAGGNTSIYAYRVFPTPDDSCAVDGSPDNQCGASTTDIASAIEDAIAQKVNVISMSLGGDVCGSGANYAPNGDSDTTEGGAVKDAIDAGIIVVAASGNSAPSTVGVSAPGCDSGVIAAGATSLADGVTNGSSITGGTGTVPIEYVTSYTQFGTVNTYQSASSWGIVAPGGDPGPQETTASGTPDDLHWIENIWTSTPFEQNGSASDTTFQGECTNDYPAGAAKSSPDCRTLIAGTSMATPHVAGAAALILAVNPSYQSPTAMKALLCSTADQLPGSTSSSNAGTVNKNQGCGRLNVYRAMAKALNDPTPP